MNSRLFFDGSFGDPHGTFSWIPLTQVPMFGRYGLSSSVCSLEHALKLLSIAELFEFICKLSVGVHITTSVSAPVTGPLVNLVVDTWKHCR